MQLPQPATPDDLGPLRPEAGSGLPGAELQAIILDHLHDAVFATDLDNVVTFWTPSAERLFGYAAGEAVGRPFGELVPYRMASAGDEADFFETLRAGRTWRGSGSVRLRDGSEIWLESTVKPIVVAGRPVGAVSVSRDMTAAKDAQQALLAHERFVDAVVEVAGALVIVLDAAGRIVRFNRACEQLSGRTAGEMVGTTLWEGLLPEREVSTVREAFAGLPGGDAAVSFEHHWVTRGGEERLISWSVSFLRDEQGGITHIIGTGIDVTEQRRAAKALTGIEAAGRLLASAGPTPETLASILDALAGHMGYGYLVLVLRDGEHWRLGAQRGYDALPPPFDPASGWLDGRSGVIGRVLRTGTPAFVPDVLADPDYIAGSRDVRSEICVPLRDDDDVLGALSIEATAGRRLGDDDLRMAVTVADRLTSALLLGREQQALRERVRILAALTEFSRVASAIREPAELWPALVSAARAVIPAPIGSLTTLDRGSGTYVVRAVEGVGEDAVGREVRPGEGAAGRTIEATEPAMIEGVPEAELVSGPRDRLAAGELGVLGIPLLREGQVLGALVVARPARGEFTPLEREAATLLGGQAALAVANVHLLEEVTELAVHDPLTGLYNRRHFDAALELIVARWKRAPEASAVSAIMFDLDRFGAFNREHGHQVGDDVLRSFAGVLRERTRSSDLVARYGGEEFVVILDACALPDAIAVAETVRTTFAQRMISAPDHGPLRATVSAGCAALSITDPTKEALLRAADVGLFMAKRAGRNQVVAV